MRTLGIDPGTATTGYCVLEEEKDKYLLICCGAIRTPKEEKQGKRLAMIFDKVCGLIDEHKPDCMAIEKLFFGTNTKTAMKVGEARGTVMLAASKAGLRTVEYSPMEVKIALTGYGKADKNQIQQMVKRLLKLDAIPKPDDAADAAAIAICHATCEKFNSKVRKAV